MIDRTHHHASEYSKPPPPSSSKHHHNHKYRHEHGKDPIATPRTKLQPKKPPEVQKTGSTATARTATAPVRRHRDRRTRRSPSVSFSFSFSRSLSLSVPLFLAPVFLLSLNSGICGPVCSLAPSSVLPPFFRLGVSHLSLSIHCFRFRFDFSFWGNHRNNSVRFIFRSSSIE